MENKRKVGRPIKYPESEYHRIHRDREREKYQKNKETKKNAA